MTDRQAKLTGLGVVSAKGDDYAVYAHNERWEMISHLSDYFDALGHSAYLLNHYTNQGMRNTDIVVVDLLTRKVLGINGRRIRTDQDVPPGFPVHHFEWHRLRAEMREKRDKEAEEAYWH